MVKVFRNRLPDIPERGVNGSGISNIAPISKTENEFQAGRSLAYHEVASLIVECSNVFNLPLEALDLFDFNPDNLL
ncbi:hypothetical protein [Mucilaginibacter sp. 10I4]|uniref:hypothetical protein n=1 Tax=Mucilaginibacter sp. 10I4 TaxID=3048580 RepID=UPI002B238FB0|nr:hypothetical protein [Mucilaginibacter sp. 10I4]MEB0261831.1 hypothetical protein [Mucilaginibacter sp. 10I4]